jgi:hypothetical protein
MCRLLHQHVGRAHQAPPSPRRQRRAWRTNHCNLLGVLLWLHGERRLLHALGLLSQGCEAAGSVPSSEATTGSPTLEHVGQEIWERKETQKKNFDWEWHATSPGT